MQKHRNKNSSTLREDVHLWCLPNDCSQFGALQCIARYEDRILQAQPGNSSGIAKSRLHEWRDSFILTDSSAASKDSTIMRRHQPVGRPPRSPASSAMDVPAPSAALCTACSSDATYTAASCRISTWMEATFNGETNYRSATILGILLQRGDSNVCCTNESFWTLFMHMKKGVSV